MKGKIFNAQEVQAMLNGSKVMFREVIKGGELEISHPAIHSWAQSPRDHKFYAKAKNDEIKQQYVTTFPFHGIKCPYQVGQKIFCKESWGRKATGNGIAYKVDNPNALKYQHLPVKWRLPQHIKQEHSRLTLQIKSIGVERLADISEEDCWKEGLEEFADYQDQVKVCQMAKQLGECIEDPRPHFATWWNATHKKPEEKFEANPWVWKVEMEGVK